MITDRMVGKIYDRIDFHDHGSEGIAEGLAEVFRDHLGELLADADLDKAQAALVRERVIRDVTRESGEERQHVADMLDAMESMGQEAVLGLTEGEPTTLRAAVQRYVDSLRSNSHSGNLEEVADDLGAILAYPYPGAELDLTDDGHVMKVSVGGSVLLTVDREDNTLASVTSAVEAVHEALTS